MPARPSTGSSGAAPTRSGPAPRGRVPGRNLRRSESCCATPPATFGTANEPDHVPRMGWDLYLQSI